MGTRLAKSSYVLQHGGRSGWCVNERVFRLFDVVACDEPQVSDSLEEDETRMKYCNNVV